MTEEPRRTLSEKEERLWDEAERNTIDEIVCRVHPDGADAIEKFWAWWRSVQSGWLGPHRACGAWLRQELEERFSIEEHGP